MKKIFFVIFLGSLYFGNAQTSLSDSLINLLKTHKTLDTNKVVLLNKLAWEFKYNNPDTSIILGQQALRIAKKNDWNYGIGKSYHSLGAFYYIKGDISKSMVFYNQALNIWDEMLKNTDLTIRNKILKSKGGTIGNIGILYWNNANYSKALECYHKALLIAHELKDVQGLSKINGNLGLLYLNQGEYYKAKDYMLLSLKYDKQLNNKSGMAIVYSNLGIIYRNLANWVKENCKCEQDSGYLNKALEYHNMTLELAEKINDKGRIESATGNIGIVYSDLDKPEKSLQQFLKAVEISREIEDKNGESIWLGNIGKTYLDLKQYDKAEKYFLEALEKSIYINARHIILENYKYLVALYDSINSSNPNIKTYIKGYEYFKKYVALKDSIFSEDQIEQQTRLEEQFKFEKIQEEERLQNAKKIAIIKAKEERQKIFTYISVFVALLILTFLFIIFNRLKVTRQQKIIIESKNKEITDSITYAKRIQTAILPPVDKWKELLPDSFVYYLPKDIVAGDFYWLETGVEALETTVYFAAADCTGHGVPGAMVSVVCSNALTKTVVEEKITEPGKILDRTRKLVIERFAKSSEDVKDGMDISLCTINFNNMTLQWAGANNPLWIVRNVELEMLNDESKNEYSTFKTQNLKLIEIKPDKQPIGKVENPQPFTTHTIELHEGDTIYIFTDGFADQFGGEKGKKFKYKPFKELLLSIQDKSMDEQKQIIEETFIKWKGDLEQVDDVCVIGVRI